MVRMAIGLLVFAALVWVSVKVEQHFGLLSAAG